MNKDEGWVTKDEIIDTILKHTKKPYKPYETQVGWPHEESPINNAYENGPPHWHRDGEALMRFDTCIRVLKQHKRQYWWYRVLDWLGLV
jgi:hypothetical protein|tara:strand:- start:12409 stop:12675 length:267 start_codon:yes stop_codon:yes gene_type:complete